MRITNAIMVNNMITQINKNLNSMQKYQDQLSSGKKIQIPSDDPIVASRALKLRTNVSEVDQYQRNVKDAQSWLDITETGLGQVGDVLHRARELAVQAANGTQTNVDTKKINEEVGQLKNQIIHIANTTYAGRYVFSGFSTDKALMDANGNFITDVDTGVENINYEVGIGDTININVCGGDLFNNGGDATGTPPTTGSLIATFNSFITALNSGNNAGLQSAITSIDKETDNLLRVRADVGARQNRLELTSNRLDSDTLNFTKLMSDNEDVDMAETIMRLKNEENVYRASLDGGARIIQPSLVDFLK